MGFLLRFSLAILLAMALFIPTTPHALAATQPIVSFVGASETAGFGLGRNETAYPEILARRCSFAVDVDGEANKPVVLRPLHTRGSAVVLFVSQFDALPPASFEEIAHWLAPVRNAIIVEAPPISGGPSDMLARYQRNLYAVLRRVAAQDGATIIPLHFPDDVGEFTEADRLHPNWRGQVLIADALEPALEAKGLCR
jgi:hypothetical protein